MNLSTTPLIYLKEYYRLDSGMKEAFVEFLMISINMFLPIIVSFKKGNLHRVANRIRRKRKQ